MIMNSFKILVFLILIYAFSGCENKDNNGKNNLIKNPTSEKQLIENFSITVKHANHCKTDNDCAIVYTECPLDCFVYVNQSEINQISILASNSKEKIEKIRIKDGQIGSCLHDCPEAKKPTCVKNICLAY